MDTEEFSTLNFPTSTTTSTYTVSNNTSLTSGQHMTTLRGNKPMGLISVTIKRNEGLMDDIVVSFIDMLLYPEREYGTIVLWTTTPVPTWCRPLPSDPPRPWRRPRQSNPPPLWHQQQQYHHSMYQILSSTFCLPLEDLLLLLHIILYWSIPLIQGPLSKSEGRLTMKR